MVEVQRLFDEPHLQNYIPASGTLVRRECHDQVGLYDPRLGHVGDWDLWLRLATRYSVGYIAEPLIAYRLHQANMSFDSRRARDRVVQLLLSASRAFDALPLDAEPALVRMRSRVLEQAALLACWQERHSLRVRASWEALGVAIRHAPWLLTRPAFYAALTRTTLLTLTGPRLYKRLSELRRRASASNVLVPPSA
jgi:hypothetical protein